MAKEKKSSKSKKQKLPEIDPVAARNLIVSLGTIINNSIHHYWLSETDMINATVESYGFLDNIINDSPIVSSTIIDKTLTVNGQAIEQTDPNIKALVDHLADLEIENFTIEKGITEDDYLKVIEIFDATPYEIEELGGFAKLLDEFGIKCITTRKVVLREVGEEELVVSKDELVEGEGGDGIGEETVGNILAFLKGDISVDDKAAVKDVQDVASNSEKMAELIMQAADVQQQAAPIESGETLVDFVVGCLKRTYEGMKEDKTIKSKIGKKRITKNLLLLEEEILTRMREMSSEWTDADFDAITDATHDMTEEMQMDSLADEYMTKTMSVKESEEKILDYIRSRGIESIEDRKLQEKLEEKGMGPEGWQELIIKSSGAAGMGAGPGAGKGSGPGKGGDKGEKEAGAGPGAGSGAGGGSGAGPGLGAGGGGFDLGGGFGSVLDAVGQLDLLLDHMEQQFETLDDKKRDKNTKKLMGVLNDVDAKVGAIASETENKIQSLLEDIVTDEAAIQDVESKAEDGGKKLAVTRKQMLQKISNIVQDINEPLALIKSSLDMVNSKSLGGINPDQLSVLQLALKNAKIINDLLVELKKMSGVDES